jgi:hypothetical protein
VCHTEANQMIRHLRRMKGREEEEEGRGEEGR